ELAHTNAPFCRNKKRYQDVLELLDNGINVICAFNIQHLESLNEMVKQATGVVVRETVPDSILKRADQVVDIDLAVEDLTDRLRAGKIYAPDKIQWALDNFFQPEKLAVLREIALREVAESVDRSVSAEADAGAARRAAASERVMVCLPTRPPPHGAMLLRQGSRLAGRLNTDWFAVHVETKNEAGHRIDATLQRYLLEDEQRARDLGAEVVRLRSEKSGGRAARVRPQPRRAPHRRRPLAKTLVAAVARPVAGFQARHRSDGLRPPHRFAGRSGGARMNLYRKLLLAQAPIGLALALVGIFSALVVSYLGSHSQTILKDNYRSVLAAQRMKEAIERMDSAALFIVADQRQKGLEQA